MLEIEEFVLKSCHILIKDWAVVADVSFEGAGGEVKRWDVFADGGPEVTISALPEGFIDCNIAAAKALELAEALQGRGATSVRIPRDPGPGDWLQLVEVDEGGVRFVFSTATSSDEEATGEHSTCFSRSTGRVVGAIIVEVMSRSRAKYIEALPSL